MSLRLPMGEAGRVTLFIAYHSSSLTLIPSISLWVSSTTYTRPL